MRPYNLECLSDPDAESGERLQFATNYFVLPALIIAHIYRQHWRVGLFFTWMKKHLRSKLSAAQARTR